MADRKAGATGDYVRAIRDLAPLVAEQRGAFDRDRRLPESIFAALADAGLFRLWLPVALGGPELTPLEFMDVVEEAAALDGTIGWLVGNGGGLSRVGGYLREDVGRAWFADPRAFIVSATGAVGTAVPVDGGYRVSGRWPFGSGAHHGTVFMGLASLPGDETSRLCCYMPRCDVTVLDTWHVSGLRGTGSCDFEVRGAFVPAAHTHAFIGPRPHQPGIVYRLPALSAFPWTVSVVPLGMARGALAAFSAIANRASRLSPAASLGERETTQATTGQCIALHRAARAYLVDAMSELMAEIGAGSEPTLHARVALRSAGAHAAETAVQIVDRLSAAAGSPAILESNPLERFMRDARAAAQHVAMSPTNHIVAGRLALGLDVGTARI